MPTYEYECTACGHAFEEFQSMMDKTLKKCPACKKNKLQRLVGAGAGIIFKGSGFYETDYKRKSGAPSASEGGSEGGSSSSSSSSASTSSASDSSASTSSSSTPSTSGNKKSE